MEAANRDRGRPQNFAVKPAILKAEHIRRAVVRGVSWVGDAVMTIPALRELRRVLPHAHLTLATRRWAEGIFADADYLDALLIEDQSKGSLRTLLKQRQRWRAERFDLAVILPNSFQSAFVAFAAGVSHRLGYAIDNRGLLLTHPVALPAWRQSTHEVYYYLHLIAELERLLTGDEQVSNRAPADAIFVSSSRQANARQFLAARGARLDRPLVALCPGSTNSRAKRWPTDRFAALADCLINEANVEVAIIGSAEEKDVTDAVVSQMNHRPLVLTGHTDLSMSVAVLSLVDLLVSNDTGPAHIAAALGRPTLAVFGPTDPIRTRPFSAAGEVLREPPACAPCMLRDCPIDHRCMTAISAAQVFARSAAILRADQHPPTVRSAQ